jgi:hypothetical protein
MPNVTSVTIIEEAWVKNAKQRKPYVTGTNNKGIFHTSKQWHIVPMSPFIQY